MEILRRIKIAFLVIFGKIDYRKDVLSIDDIYNRLYKLSEKINKDPYVNVYISKGSAIGDEGSISSKYKLYSNEPYPKGIYSNNLEIAFELMSKHLNGIPIENKADQKIISV